MPYLNKALLVSCLFLLPLHSALFDHLKKIEGKGTHHTFPKIDFIYMINLDERPEKFAQTSSELASYEIFPYRFSAVNGWKLPLEVINDIGLVYQKDMLSLFATSFPLEGNGVPSNDFMAEEGKTYFAHCAARGTIGCSLSHLCVLKDAYDSGYETVWVLEDDVVAVQDPRILPDLIEKLDTLVGKDGWDILFTDMGPRANDGTRILSYGAAKRPDINRTKEERFSEKFTTTTIISEDFEKTSSRFGAYSMIIRRSGIKKLLDFFAKHQIFHPYDLEYYLPEGIRLYSLRYDLITNLIGALTDNGVAGYQNK